MIKSLNFSNIDEVAKIHMETLKGDFFPSLGINFLKTFYEGVIGKSDVYGFGVFDRGKLYGFVVGTNDSGKFFSEIFKSRFLKLTFIVLTQLIKNPSLIKKTLETFLYTDKVKGPKSELVVIAVDKNFQGKGAGKILVNALEKAFKRGGIKQYKLTVHADKKAIGFYEHLKFSRLSAFNLYGKMWYVYEKNINTSKKIP